MIPPDPTAEIPMIDDRLSDVRILSLDMTTVVIISTSSIG